MKKGLSALWILSIGCAFSLGYKVKTLPPTQNSPSVIHQIEKSTEEQQGIIKSVDNVSNANLVEQKIPDTTKQPAAITDIVTKLKHQFGNSRSFIDIAAIAASYDLVKNLTEDELLEALLTLKSELDTPSISTPFNVLISRYAELNPEHSIRFVEDNIQAKETKMTAILSIIEIWSKNEPLKAYAWYEQTKDNNEPKGMHSSHTVSLVSIFDGLTNNDFPDAIEKLVLLSNDGENSQMAVMGMAVSGITNSITEPADFITLLEKTEQMENSEIRHAVISNWVMKDPNNAKKWIDSLENSEDKEILKEDAFFTWMMMDPSTQAADWYMDGADEANKQHYVDNVVQNWGHQSPAASLNWLHNQTGIDTEKSMTKLLESSAFNNINFTIKHLDLLINEKNKETVSFSIYMALEHQNKKRAADFLASSPYKEQLEKEKILLENTTNNDMNNPFMAFPL